MADLSGIINSNSPGAVVDAWHAANYWPRPGIGISEIGEECQRRIWYKHNNYATPPLEGRVLRLFRAGQIIEDMAILDLKTAGYTVHSQQKEITITNDGIALRGRIDAVIEGLLESSKPHLFECKSSNTKRFNELKKVGYEAWSAKYKTQCHVYMLGMKLKRCLVWVECKETSEVYTERFKINMDFAIEQLQRAFSIMAMDTPPDRSCPRKDWFKAKMCPYSSYCWTR